MAIIVKTKESENKTGKPFPKLMKSKDGRIVFATGKHNGEDWEVLRISGFPEGCNGTISQNFKLFHNDFIMYSFYDFEGQLLLENQ